MTVRRLAAAVLTAIWLLPVAIAGGVALHVLFEHDHAEASHEFPGHAASLPALLEHGHLHGEASGDHDHVAASASSVAARVARSVASPPPSSLVDRADLVSPVAPSFRGGSPWSPPPQATGPPLLALLATLRV